MEGKLSKKTFNSSKEVEMQTRFQIFFFFRQITIVLVRYESVNTVIFNKGAFGLWNDTKIVILN